MAFIYAAAAVFGLIIGSFLNVCIYRLPIGKSIIYPPSSCPACGAHIKPWHNIPVISWLLLGGRCADCRARISAIYPAVEALNALCYIAALYRFGPTAKAAVVMALLSSFIVITFIDIKHQIIPNWITLPGIILGLIFGPLVFDTGIKNSLLGVLVGGGLFFVVGLLVTLVLRKQSLGLGDVKLMAMVGAFFGWEKVLESIFFGSLLGSGIMLTLIGLKKFDRKNYFPFGPFLVLGTVFAIFFGQEFLKWYFDRIL